MRMPDESLEYWSDIYVIRGIKQHGITLEQFLRFPRTSLARIDQMQAAAMGRAGDHVEPGLQFHRPPHHSREIRRSNRLWQRGAVIVQKIWHGDRKRNRTNAPLSGRR